ncbi:MAG: YfiR family protein [Alphaproteobacteria bacterium]|nr:YfiR family protein [Alphaproteobacteria bacterium]
MREVRAQITPYMQLAEFVINVSDHIKWPNYEEPLHLCVHGYDLIAMQLLTKKQIKLLKVNLLIREVKNVTTDSLRSCSLLYVATNEERNLMRIIDTAELTKTLTISVLEGFVAKGGTIEFQLIRGQVKVYINGMQLDRWSIRVSQLLQPFVK